LLDHIKENCDQFNYEFSKLESGQNSSEHYLNFFHWPGATYLTASLFESIKDLLNHYKALINGKKNSDNLAE